MSDLTKRRGAWDLESVYDEQINPLMKRIIAICKKHRMPMLASFAYADDGPDGEEHYCSTALNWPGRETDALNAALREIRRRPFALAITVTTRPPTAAPAAKEK